MRTIFLLLSWCVAAQDSAVFGAGLDELQGNWMVKKTNSEGRVYSQHLQFEKDKVTFELRNEDGEPRFIAKAKAKTDQAGPLKTLTLLELEAGRAGQDLEPVDDTRTSVYTVRDDKLIVASNFDRERDNERPGLDVYSRAASAKTASARPSDIPEKLLGTWDLELVIGEDTLDYQLAIEKGDNGLQATLISPRSGKHKFKAIEFKNGQLKMEIDREVQGQETTLTYVGKLSETGLSGKVTARGLGDSSATWRATR